MNPEGESESESGVPGVDGVSRSIDQQHRFADGASSGSIRLFSEVKPDGLLTGLKQEGRMAIGERLRRVANARLVGEGETPGENRA